MDLNSDFEIRPITEQDAGIFLELGKKLDQETKFLMLEPGERNWTVERQQEMLRMFLSQKTNMILLAMEKGHLVGYVGAQGGKFHREEHSINLSVGVLRDYRRRGVGEQLMLALEEWAKQQGIHRMELSTMVHNTAAQHLYEKLGYEREGRRRHSIKLDGEFVDEWYMSKLV